MEHGNNKITSISKKVISLLVAGILSLSAIPNNAKAYKGDIGDVIKTNKVISLYDKSTDGNMIGEISPNETITRIIDCDGYDLVNYNNHLGFANIDDENSDSEYFDYEELDRGVYGITTSALRMRTEPSTAGDIITTIKADTPIELLAVSDDGWYLVDYNNTLGFMCGDYIRNDNTSKEVDSSIDYSELYLPNLVPYVEAVETVNIRANSSTDSEDIGDLKRGQSLKLINKLDDGWCEVEYNGSTAYVCSKYVKDVYRVDGDIQNIVCLKDNSYLYDNPNGNIVTSIPKYEAGFVYWEDDNYCFVEVDGDYGYVLKSDTNKLTDTCVIVDISDQKLELYSNNKLILSTSVVTGKDSSPSDIGLFKIRKKTRDTHLVGPGYDCPVKVWMPYNGGEGLHDASWRKKFGGNIYRKNGSHGCVNIPTDKALEIYDNVSVRDHVLVKR